MKNVSASTPSPLKIGLICDWYLPRIGGTEMHLHDLALRLAGEGHDVQVITPTRGQKETDGIPAHRLEVPLFPGLGVVWTKSAFAKIESILKSESYDVVHCHGNIFSPAAYGAVYLSQKMGIPVMITWKSILGVYTPVLAFLNLLFRWSKWPVVFSAVSGVAAEDVKSIVKNKPVHILPNGIDVSDWKAARVPGNPGETLMVSVMRLIRKKRPDALIKMVPKIIARISPDIRLKVKIIGEGPDKEALEKLISRHSLKSTVELAGYKSREEIRDIFARSDIYVCASKWESFGIAALEARCAGLPVVALESGGVKEIVEHGREGLIGKTDDEMVDHLVRLVREPETLSSLAEYNRDNPPPMNWNEVIVLHLSLYRTAIDLQKKKGRRSPP